MRKQGTIFLGGPPLVKAATGETVTAEDLGGADVHTRLSGVADHYALERRPRARDRAQHRRQPQHREDRSTSRCASRARRPTTRPRSTACVPASLMTQYDAREVIARLVDGSEIDEFKPNYAHHAGHRLRPHRGHAGRRSSPTTASSIPRRRRRPRTSSSSPASARSRCCSCRTSPASWSGGGGGRRHRPRRRQDGDGGRLRQRAEDHGDHRRQLRRRQLRHVRARLLARASCSPGRTRASR